MKPKLKLKFESDLDYQQAAIEAVCDLFRGQEVCRTEFTVTRSGASQQDGFESGLGIGNRMSLLDDELLHNLRDVQLRNGLPPSEKLQSGDFTVEMETGTGKTYVYLRTIYELNKTYGFNKFIIVVPSVAIKEGVYKSLQIMKDHFGTLYANVPVEFFLYDSSKLGLVRSFATSGNLQIMVMTVGAINKKDFNNLYKDSEKTGGDKPIDLVKATRPILIVDEPQSVDGGLEGRGKEALEAMNPLCTLRYSATHVDKHHMVYRLDAVDAYEKKLVKQIEVASATVIDAHNRAYVRLLAVSNKRNVITAKIEVDKETASGVKRVAVTVQDGDDLEQTTGRAIYQNCRVGTIKVKKGYESMELRVPGSEPFLTLGHAWGDVDVMAVQRQMIRRTIHEHLNKEKSLRRKGIKVLTLFFIDQVAKYRQHDAAGNLVKGEYARIFEEEYQNAAELPKYRQLFEKADLTDLPEQVHNGYFSIDKRGGWLDTAENNQAGRDNAERAYNLIMKDKEKLLSLDEPLKFIFSHSALREGWDNPNVFQICTLRDIHGERERRQTIGRGLRLCVNQEGERVRGFEVNRLTVIANESYEDFAESLQQEIEKDTGIRFGIVENHVFASIPLPLGDTAAKALWAHLIAEDYIDAEGHVLEKLRRALMEGSLQLPPSFAEWMEPISEMLKVMSAKGTLESAPLTSIHKPLGVDRSKALWTHLKANGYIDAKGHAQEALKNALQEGTLQLPLQFADLKEAISVILNKLSAKLKINNADERRTVQPRHKVLDSAEFRALWDRIKHKTTYRVDFDNESLIRECVAALEVAIDLKDGIPKARLQWRKANMAVGKAGIVATEGKGAASVAIQEGPIDLPDLLTELQDRTQLTRRSLVAILTMSDRLSFYRDNPQKFIELTTEAINRRKRLALVDGIQYHRLGDEYYYAQELFEQAELSGYLNNLLDVEKSVYEQVIYDSDTEAEFARQLENNDAIKVYAKLPGWFKIPTPLGSYNPDWAVLVQREDGEHLYFVVETKSSLWADDLRDKESAKIMCGKRHFERLACFAEPPARYMKAKDLEKVLLTVQNKNEDEFEEEEEEEEEDMFDDYED